VNPVRETNDEAELFPIRTVSSLTGVNPITLRAWERRHGLISPVRSESGHRLYSRDDIDTILRITALLDKGVAISQARSAIGAPTRHRPAAVDIWTSYRERMIAAIDQFDENRLEDVYNEVLSLHATEIATRTVLLPLLSELGRRWENKEGGVAEEHFFGVYLRNKLGARFHHRRRLAAGPRLLVSCITGEQHEIGLFLFALAAHDAGFQMVLLGADMPLADLAYAARRARADAIVLSGSIEPALAVLAEHLPKLVAESGVPVFVGGLNSVRRHEEIVAAGAIPVGTDIDAGLRHIATHLSPESAARAARAR